MIDQKSDTIIYSFCFSGPQNPIIDKIDNADQTKESAKTFQRAYLFIKIKA